MKKTTRILTASTLLGLLATPAQAAIVVNNTGDLPSYTVADDDLLQTSVASVTDSGLANGNLSGDTTFLAGFDPNGEPSLRDGVWQNVGTQGRGAAMTENGDRVDYFFDLTVSPEGYNIDQIDLYSNWGTGDGRNEIEVTISLSLVATPGVFDQVVVSGEAFNPDAGTTQARMSITDDSGFIGTGIAGIRFDWPSGQENGAVGYSELDVIGSAVPEPSAAILGGLGGLLLLRRRRA